MNGNIVARFLNFLNAYTFQPVDTQDATVDIVFNCVTFRSHFLYLHDLLFSFTVTFNFFYLTA